MQPVVVYDTNVLISGIGWKGPPHRCLELARQDKVEGLTCQEILDELTPKLLPILNYSPSQIRDTIGDLRGFLRLIRIANALKGIVNDPDDDKIIECAVVGKATHIVTGDDHLLSRGSYRGILIVKAADFLAQFP